MLLQTMHLSLLIYHTDGGDAFCLDVLRLKTASTLSRLDVKAHLFG